MPLHRTSCSRRTGPSTLPLRAGTLDRPMGISRLRRKPKAETPAAEQEVLPVISTASDDDRAIVEAILPKGASITSAERILALVDAVGYCVARDVPGAFAECGVWRGGSVMAMILTLQRLGCD